MKLIDDINNRAHLQKLLREERASDESDLLELWDSLESYTDAAKTDVARENEILATLIEQTKRSQVKRPALRLVASPVFRYGVAAAIAFIAIGLWFFLVPVNQTAAPGATLAVSLPDGSTVELNSGSSVEYRRYFVGGRHVSLDGEAFFDVEISDKTFEVNTFNANVAVLGTEFNVRAWKASVDPITTVTVVSGRVELSNLLRTSTAILSPGETRTVALSADVSSAIRDEAATALSWRDGNLMYKDQVLGVILEDVQRKFGTRITLSVPEISQRRVSLSFHDPESPESVVRTICGAYSLNYRTTSGGFEIFETN